MSDILTERARRYFNFGTDAEVPPVCVDIMKDLQAAEQSYRDATSYEERRRAMQLAASINQKVLDMITPPRARCPCCGL